MHSVVAQGAAAAQITKYDINEIDLYGHQGRGMCSKITAIMKGHKCKSEQQRCDWSRLEAELFRLCKISLS